jgi:hypothetical protein
VDVSLLEKTGEILCSEKDITVIVGPQMFHYSDNRSLVNSLLILSNLDKINLVPLYFGSNSRGALEMSVFPEKSSISKATPRIIYLAGDIPFTERPACDFLIVQDIYMPPFKVDAFLPASSFVEAAGTLINIEGRVQEVVQIECLPQGLVTGFMQPDWKIFSDLANLIKPGLMNYESDNDIRAEIHGVIPDFPETPDRKPRCMKPLMDLEIVRSATGSLKHGEFLQAAGPGRYRHRGIDLVSKVRGLKELTL